MTRKTCTKTYNEHLTGCLDALVDIQYILDGTTIAFGMQTIFSAAFTAVHENNMSKLCKTADEAQATIDFYMETKDIRCFYEETPNGNYVVKCDIDPKGVVPHGKIMKQKNYKPVKLSKFIDAYDKKEN